MKLDFHSEFSFHMEFSEVGGIDYKETFAPVIRDDSDTSDISALMGSKIHQINVKTAL